MRKLKLESLQVESFETAPPAQGRGTMHGHQRPPKPSDGCYDTNMDMDCTYGCATWNYDCETQDIYCDSLECTNECQTYGYGGDCG